MGQKVSPFALRLGINKDWISRWYADKKNYGKYAVEDQKIRKFVKKEYNFAGLQKIEIERNTEKTIVIVYCAKPSFIIGRRGIKADKLTEDLVKLCGGRVVDLKVIEVLKPELSAQLVGDSIAQQLEKQSHHRRIMHKVIETVMEAGALGIKIRISGRIGGAEIARAESLSKGSVPLHTLKADIDYARSTATLSKGTVGVKVWIYKGIIEKTKKPHGVAAVAAPATSRLQPRREEKPAGQPGITAATPAPALNAASEPKLTT
ncbi:MAG: 30S ribosomal protein S3 [Planctomycetes bacterium]|nr:30S ribosomal protein S3 [Planctomycetota bacterium]